MVQMTVYDTTFFGPLVKNGLRDPVGHGQQIRRIVVVEIMPKGLGKGLGKTAHAGGQIQALKKTFYYGHQAAVRRPDNF